MRIVLILNGFAARSAAVACLAAGLSAVGAQAARAAEEPGGPVFGASVLGVGQRVGGSGSDTGFAQRRGNLRGDFSLEMPAGEFGSLRGRAYLHLRAGHGMGVGLRPSYTGTVNSTGFGGSGPNDSYGRVAEAYYALHWPTDERGSGFTLGVGKMDSFVFFDQNAVAGDEARQFLNNVFVHNPLLDSGGDTAADAFGFAPGVRLAYERMESGWRWGWSMGVFGSGPGTNLGGAGRPYGIAQFEVSPSVVEGEPLGTWRVYVWSNDRTQDVLGARQRHTGIGLSVDQRVGEAWNLFGRYGRRVSGGGAFDSALTAGFEYAGRRWGRADDALGFAVGWLRTGRDWRTATADGTLAGYAASGSEMSSELYYRWQVSRSFSLSPDFQFIRRAGGDGTAAIVRVFGLRANLSFGD